MKKDGVVLYGETEDMLTAEWADRSLDDEDRYLDDTTIFIRVEVPKEQGRKALNTQLHKAYDEWIEERT
jgi:hypothetical protein